MENNAEEWSYIDETGRTVHVFKDEFGEETTVTEYRMSDYIFMGEQWCPHCLVRMEHHEDAGEWVCPSCGNNIGDDDVEIDGGIPSLGAALDWRAENGLY